MSLFSGHHQWFIPKSIPIMFCFVIVVAASKNANKLLHLWKSRKQWAFDGVWLKGSQPTESRNEFTQKIWAQSDQWIVCYCTESSKCDKRMNEWVHEWMRPLLWLRQKNASGSFQWYSNRYVNPWSNLKIWMNPQKLFSKQTIHGSMIWYKTACLVISRPRRVIMRATYEHPGKLTLDPSRMEKQLYTRCKNIHIIINYTPENTSLISQYFQWTVLKHIFSTIILAGGM